MRAQTVKVEEHLEADLGPVEGVGAGLPRVIFGDGDDSSPEKKRVLHSLDTVGHIHTIIHSHFC